MTKIILPLAISATLLGACSTDHNHEHTPEPKGLEALAHTIYTDYSELFVEFKPPVVGTETRFAAHFTILGEQFLPLEEATITLTLLVNGKAVQVEATKPEVPGIFRLRLLPDQAGVGKLVFTIKTKDYTDEITIDSVHVYADEKAALAAQPETSESSDINYLKEQAWKVEFANAPVSKKPFANIIKTSGQIFSAPGDEAVVAAKASGIVLFQGRKTMVGTEVNASTGLFSISGSNMAGGNIDDQYKIAQANYEKAQIDYNRAKELVKDKIVSERDFEHAKLQFETAQTTFNTLAKNHTTSGQTVVAGMNGFVKSILVSEGQFVEAGTPLAIISKNQRLVLQANVSQKYFPDLAKITSANFKLTDSDQVFSTLELNGKLVSYGKSASANSPFILVSIEIDNPGALIAGSVVEVFLRSNPVPDALVIPETALIEEQGIFFVYVQMGGESFQKREVKLGPTDGLNVQVLNGVVAGERVVTKGAYQIKLSMAAGTLPAHGHEH